MRKFSRKPPTTITSRPDERIQQEPELAFEMFRCIYSQTVNFHLPRLAQSSTARQTPLDATQDSGGGGTDCNAPGIKQCP